MPTRRTSVTAGERLTLKAIVLDGQPARDVTACWRPMGSGGAFAAVPFQHAARGVYTVTLPAEATARDLEYQIKATTAGGAKLKFPPGAPETSRTVVVMPSR